MKRGMRGLAIILVGLLVLPFAAALEGHIPLLALVQNDTGVSGSVADLELSIVDGRQRVFLETVPLTRIATQISMRFAQQVACRELEFDCAGKDFLYTIKASPGVIGGPSAGAASAVLTGALLLGLDLRNDTVITGTINSGGLIGPVGGIRHKLEAAAAAGYARALVPPGAASLGIDDLDTNISAHAASLGLELREVGTLAEALAQFTGYQYPRPAGDLAIAPRYQRIMREVEHSLCTRARNLLREAEALAVDEALANFTRILLNRSDASRAAGAQYAAASYCFRSGVILRQEVYRAQELGDSQLLTLAESLAGRRKRAAAHADAQTLASMTDVQAYIAVKERLSEAADALVDALDALGRGDRDVAAGLVAYAEERVFSAESWASFFDSSGVMFALDEERLRQGCGQRISEAEERLSYAELELPVSLADVRQDIDRANAEFKAGEYVLCLGTASIAKARADLVLSLAGVEEEDADALLELKLDAARSSLLRTLEQGIFPMLAYSYYEYASSLAGFDDQFALLFAEYALELSSLDIYLGQPLPVEQQAPSPQGGFLLALFALAGLALVAGAVALVLARKRRKGVIRSGKAKYDLRKRKK